MATDTNQNTVTFDNNDDLHDPYDEHDNHDIINQDNDSNAPNNNKDHLCRSQEATDLLATTNTTSSSNLDLEAQPDAVVPVKVDRSMKNPGLHRSNAELQAKLFAVRKGECMNTTNLSHDVETAGSELAIAGAVPVKGVPNSKHTLHRTDEERQAKVTATTKGMQNRNMVASHGEETTRTTTKASQQQGKLHFLGRNRNDQEAKKKAMLSTILSAIGTNHESTSAEEIWEQQPCNLDDDQFQSSSVMPAANEEEHHSVTNSQLYPLEVVPSSMNDVDGDPEEYLATPTTMHVPPSPTHSNADSVLGRTAIDAGLVEARQVVEESSRRVLQEALRLDANYLAARQKTIKERKQQECRQIGNFVIVVVVVVIAISLGIGMRRDSNTETSMITPTVTPTAGKGLTSSSLPIGHLDLLYVDLLEYTQKSIQNASTPQRAAWEWLSNHQNISQLQLWKKKQLFALATFFCISGRLLAG